MTFWENYSLKHLVVMWNSIFKSLIKKKKNFFALAKAKQLKECQEIYCSKVFSLLWYNHMFSIHKIYKLQVKPTDTTAINSGICCKMPLFHAFTVSDYSWSKPVNKNWCAKILTLSGCSWVEAKHTIQTAPVGIQNALVAKCKEHLRYFVSVWLIQWGLVNTSLTK